MDHGADVDTPTSDGRTPLWTAGFNGHLAVVEHLADHGADLNAATVGNGRTAIWAAAFNGDLGVVRVLCDRGADVDCARIDTGSTPVWTASYRPVLIYQDSVLNLFYSF